jgi:beta-aspartyl-peptidase (threonine type)
VVAYDLACYYEYTGTPIDESCRHVVHERNRDIKGDLGMIAIDKEGKVGMAFNSQRMHRAWIGLDGELHVKIYS